LWKFVANRLSDFYKFKETIITANEKEVKLYIEEASLDAVKITSMVFAILIGATAFSMVFTYSGADGIIEDFLTSLPHANMLFIFLVMAIIFSLGFFIDFIEISYIVIPILLPAASDLGINPVWFAILIAMNLQSSFLTPPFGFSLFYLKGVAPKEVTTIDMVVVMFLVLEPMLLILCLSPLGEMQRILVI
jgi:TRAP-type mannitol/chloroaromatic compound transport system permease large subunit